MFLPVRLALPSKLGLPVKSKGKRILYILSAYVLTLMAGLGIAAGINNLTINSLYISYSKNEAFLSVSKIEENKLEDIKHIVAVDNDVKSRLINYGISDKDKFLNYVVPIVWNVPEIPMNTVPGVAPHNSPSDFDRDKYKIIFTKVEVRGNSDVEGTQLITNGIRRIPIVEIWVDTKQSKVTKIMDIPEKVMYENIPVAVY
jgi:hypothetical protein